MILRQARLQKLREHVAMNYVCGSQLQEQGVDAVAAALSNEPVAAITVDGELRYVVMTIEERQRLHECELVAAQASNPHG